MKIILDGLGELDVDYSKINPITKKVRDIRNISSRSGSYTKTISLLGTKNNNLLLNSYFDVNVVGLYFDVNKVHHCSVIENGKVLIFRGTLRLLKVIKVGEGLVSYEVQIVDVVGDYFKELQYKTLIDLHLFDGIKTTNSLNNIENSWNNSLGYRFGLNYSDVMEIVSGNFLPYYNIGKLFKAINEENGITYSLEDRIEEELDNMYLPFNGSIEGEVDKINQRDETIVRDNTSTSINSTPHISILLPTRGNFNPNIVLKDAEGRFTTGANSQYLVPYNTSLGNNTIDVDVKLVLEEMRLVCDAIGVPSPQQVRVTPSGDVMKPNYVKFKPYIEVYSNVTGTVYGKAYIPQGGLGNLTSLGFELQDEGYLMWTEEVGFIELEPYMGANIVPLALSGNSGIPVRMELTNVLQGDALRFRVGIEYETTFTDTDVWFQGGIGGSPLVGSTNFSTHLEISNIDIQIRYSSSNTLPPNTIIELKEFLPRGVLQSDFLKGIMNMFNLYILENGPEGDKQISYLTRDKFYSLGQEVDWTDKLSIEHNIEILYLPEVTSREMVLSYKEDSKDDYLTTYKKTYSKEFGELEYVFNNRNVRGAKREEVMFAPTINRINMWGLNLPFIDYSGVPRVLYYNGYKEGVRYFIDKKERDKYPLFEIFYYSSSGDRISSLEFGRSKSYGYEVEPSFNTLGSMYWENTLRQINTGRMLIGWFHLNSNDVSIPLNTKIIINGVNYYINAIVDYIGEGLTKVELITVE